jgi:hypothetical protein
MNGASMVKHPPNRNLYNAEPVEEAVQPLPKAQRP